MTHQTNGHVSSNGRSNHQASAAPIKTMWLSDLSIKRPHFITMLMVAVIVVGALFYSRMGVDLFPNISVPVMAIRTTYPGASPSEIERAVTRPIEDALASLNGVDVLTSTSADGVSQVTVQFQMERNVQQATDDVRGRLDLIRGNLPADAGDPTVLKFDPSALPILSIAVSDTSGKRSPEQMRALMDDEIKPRLENLPGVATISVSGGVVREIHVDLSRDRMDALGVAAQQIAPALRGENLDVPGGRVASGNREQSIKTSGQFTSIDQIGEVPVPTTRGQTARLKDFAEVTPGHADARALRRLDGHDAVIATLQKQSGSNQVAVADAVKHELNKIRADYPELEVAVTADQSEYTKESVNDVQFSLVLGALLAALVVFAFFRDWRNTLVTVSGLPVVLLGTFAVMHVLGIGLNMITLMALSLSIGMLIDDAIVVRENIFRHMEAGEHPKVAAQRGTAEIALAVVAVSSTIVAVFLPIAFTSGIVGMFLRDFGLTIAIAVLISLVEAFTLAPMLSAYLFRRVERHDLGDRRASLLERAFGRMDAGYRRLLSWCLGHRVIVLGIGVAMFVASLGLIPFMTFSFTPESDQGAFTVTAELPPGARLQDSDRIARNLEEVLLRQPGVADVLTTVGSDDGTVERTTLNVKLTSKGHGVTKRTLEALRPELEAAARGARFSASPEASSIGSGGGLSSAGGRSTKPIQFAVQGPPGADLETASRRVVDALARVPGTIDIDRSSKAGRPGVEIVVDRARAADLGVSTASVGTTVRALVSGERVGTYQDGDRELGMIVRLQAADRATTANVLGLQVATSRGTLLPISSVAAAAPASEPTLIERKNRARLVTVTAGVHGAETPRVTADAARAVAALDLPAGVTAVPAGTAAQTADAFSSLGIALALSVLFVYMILCAQFGSFVHPFTIMLALPFSIVGALLGLFVTGKGLDMLGFIGLILLMGLVTKNSILLVDLANQLREQGRATRDALLEAGPARLRPILMTTLAMIFGMLPLALGIGTGAELRQSMGIGVIGGLLTSTVLTLVAVPVAYSLIDDLMRRVRTPRLALMETSKHAAQPQTAAELVGAAA